MENISINLSPREIRLLNKCIYTTKYLSFAYPIIDNKELGLLLLKIKEHLNISLQKNGFLVSSFSSFYLDEKIGNAYKYNEEMENLKKHIEIEDDWLSLTNESKKEIIIDYFEPYKYQMETIEFFLAYGDNFHRNPPLPHLVPIFPKK